jgi:TrmH family RNA methyltransferase
MSSLPIRFVLVETSHPGNIGAVARAMKNMGVHDLVLVAPREYPHPEATARASGADDVLQQARVVQTLPQAIADCSLVLATTARTRDQYFRVVEVREAAQRMVAEARSGSGAVAVLFGTERYGLSNEQLQCAHTLLRIPANPEYSSLNIAMAAQLIAYEVLMAQHESGTCQAPRDTPLATREQMEGLFGHLQVVMDTVGFQDRTRGGTHLMARIRRLFSRAELDNNELNILRGFLTAVQGKRRKAGDEH